MLLVSLGPPYLSERDYKNPKTEKVRVKVKPLTKHDWQVFVVTNYKNGEEALLSFMETFQKQKGIFTRVKGTPQIR